MKRKVVWQRNAIIQRNSILEYIIREFGKSPARKFNAELKRCQNLICSNPLIAPLEQLLSGMEKTYRSILVSRLSKMIFYEEEGVIHIVALWDTRRCPDKMKDEV